MSHGMAEPGDGEGGLGQRWQKGWKRRDLVNLKVRDRSKRIKDSRLHLRGGETIVIWYRTGTCPASRIWGREIKRKRGGVVEQFLSRGYETRNMPGGRRNYALTHIYTPLRPG